MTEEEALARIILLLSGSTPSEAPEQEIAALLMMMQPPEILEGPQTPEIALQIAGMALQGVPDPEGVPDLLEGNFAIEFGDSHDVVDLVWSDGIAGAGAYARELLLRARYAINAVGRLGRSALSSDSPGSWRAGLKKEASHFLSHRKAQKIREGKTRVIDNARAQWGDVLGWYGVKDSATTPECHNAIGKNFNVLQPPRIGLPGLGPHPNCRCHPGPPFPEGEMI